MTDNTQEINEIIREMRYRVLEDNGLTVNGLTTIEQDTKQALLDWHNKRELEAMIDTLEYAKISPKFKIEEKIEQLRLEMEKYEQTNDKNS